MAVLLSAVLIFGMMSNEAPISVLAQESVSENTPAPVEGETEQEEGKETDPAEEMNPDDQKDQEETEDEEKTDSEKQEPEEGKEQEKPQPEDGKGETPEPGKEDEKEQESVSENDAPTESVSENDAEPEPVAKPLRMMRAAADDIASGDGWVLAGDGTLTIESDDGMSNWTGKRTFYNKQVTSVEIQNGVTGIGDIAFNGCSNLTEITIPETVTSIGENAFGYCGLTEITIPETVTSIKAYVFTNCKSLTSVVLPDNLTSIKMSMFQQCTGLKSITIPESVESIEGTAFFECTGLTGITIPENVTSIGERAFFQCSALTSITIPKNVTSIGANAFNGCDELAEVIMNGETPPTLSGNQTFLNCGFWKKSAKGIHVPEGKAEAYKTAWTDWARYIADDTAPAEKHEHDGVTFTAWTATDSLPTDAGNYYLTENVTLSKTWKVPSGETSLCLNGKTVRAQGAYRVITIGASNTLNLYDCTDSGMITGGQQGGVIINKTGIFYMYGGKISGNDSSNLGAGIYTSGTFYLYGGEISDNTTTSDAGGVKNDGTFYMHGGKIANNKAGGYTGGVWNGYGHEFYMYDGEITGNQAKSSAGVNNDNGASLYLYGGVISGNHATDSDGKAGVYHQGTSMTVGGSIVINDNTNGNGESSNLCIQVNRNISIDSSNPLAAGAYISVTTHSAPTKNYPRDITGVNNADYSQYFHSDNSAYVIVDSADHKVQLALPHTHTLTLTPAKDATCTEDGNKAYYVCGGNDGCGKMFSDQACTNELSTKPVLPALGHSYGSTWEKDENGHWHECSRCQEKEDQAEHTYDDDSDTDCNICGYQRSVHTHSLTRVDAKAATCTADGNKAYYVCGGDDGCGKWFLDEAGTQEITDKDSVKIPKTGHSYDTSTWGYQTEDGHAHECANCDAHDEVQAHTPGAAATATTPQTCTVCGYIMAAAIGHTCSPQPVAKKEPTCTASGKQAYYHCEGCDKNYEDAEGTTSIADISAWGTIAALGHDWGAWKVTKPATATKPGEKERICKRCGEKETETVPATGGGSGGGNQGGGNNSGGGDGGSGENGGSNGGNGGTSPTNPKPGKPGASGTGQPKVKQEKKGNIQKEVRVEGEAVPDAEVATTLSNLADIVLTETEKQQAEAGTNIRIVLDVKDAAALISASDRTVVEMALNGSLAKGYTLGQYLDISLYKVVGNRRSDITQTSRKITVVIRVPDSLKNTDTKKARTFAVIRVHDGKAELLTDLDNEEDTVTVETDRFSTYAIVWRDAANKDGGTVRVRVENGGNKKAGGGMDDEPETGDATPLELCATLSMIAGFTYLLLYFADRRRGMTEETKKELVSRLIGWGKRGGRIRRYLALAAIFVLLVYYHSIGKKTCVNPLTFCQESGILCIQNNSNCN